MKKLFKLVLLMLLCDITFAQQTLDEKVDSVANLLTINEKIDQLINNGFMTTPLNNRVGIPGFVMNDGPHGNRFDISVSFPVSIAVASTFDRKLAYRVGKAMGEEFWGWNKDVQLGPCIDLCRDPRNGRSGETGGEDPYLSGEIGTEVTKGIQRSPVIATIKHYNCQNKEDYRHTLNATISERNLMEHYGINFKKAVQDGGSWSLMSAYNLINGDKSAESYNTLTTILRERWGFPFFVMSDWGGIWDSKKAINAGNDVCMGSDKYKNDLLGLYNAGGVSGNTITKSAKNVIKTKMISGMMDANRPIGSPSNVGSADHLAVCKEAGQKAMILLKNKDNILPLNKNTLQKILIVGPSAAKAQLDGFGSAWVNATYTVSPKQGIETKIGTSKVDYAFGCPISVEDLTDFNNAKAKAATADVVVFVGGLDDTMEGEGYGEGGDRKNGTVTLPRVQYWLINELAAINPNIVVVLNSGGICAVNPFVNNIKGLIYAFYPGQEGGNALADVLFGDYNPAGRLPVTMPKNDAQIQAVNDDFNDDYLCGYRYNDKINQIPEYAFGFGLSYTSFAYSNIRATGTAPVTVSVDIKNTGSVEGEEVPQLYLTDDAATIPMPNKQLKGFERVMIQPGETKTISFDLLAEDFQYWDETSHTYKIEAGTFTAKVGPSSDNLPLSVSINPTAMIGKPDLVVTTIFSNPRYPLAGDLVTFYALVVNKGDAPTTTGIAHTVDLAINGITVTGSTTELILAGGMKMVTLATNTWKASDGKHFFVATVDGKNLLSESIENNNTFSDTLNVSANIDNPNDNLCLKKPVTVSSSEGTYSGANGVDGSFGTRWSSLAKDGEWMIVDLQDSYDINKVKIFWEAAFASAYTVDLALTEADFKDNKWINVVTVTNGTGGNVIHDLQVTGRYLRIVCVTRGTLWGNSFYEIQAFGYLSKGVKLTLNKADLVLTVGATEQLIASKDSVKWESYIPSIATVDSNGIVKGIMTGLTTIIARSADGVEIAACNVSVTPEMIDPASSCEIIQYQLPAQMEAECYQSMSGIQVETCTDTGGGKHVGYFDLNDWVEYQVTAPESHTYTFRFRNSSLDTDGKLEIWLDGEYKSIVLFTSTGGWQTWTTRSMEMDLSAGVHNIRFIAKTDRFNINWIEITKPANVLTNQIKIADPGLSVVSISPNPFNDKFSISTSGEVIEEVQIVDINGRTILYAKGNNQTSIDINMFEFSQGVYFLKLLSKSTLFVKKIIKR